VHRKKLQAIAAIIVIVSAVYSCKKGQKDDLPVLLPGEIYAPVAYVLQYPDFVGLKIGGPALPADNPLTVEGVALGKKLFFDARLSGNNSVSCGSCHGQQHSFDDTTQFSIGVNGVPGDRNSMPLINLAWNSRFFWDGRRNSLEAQAHDPVVNPVEMNSNWPDVLMKLQKDTIYPGMFFKAFGTRKIDSQLAARAIAQFVRTLTSFNSRYDRLSYKGEDVFTFSEMKGYELFNKFLCPSCHKEGLLTDGSFRNNGLDLLPVDSGLAKFTHSPADYGKFKTPTLRNIALTAPYMHDGRFATLREVVFFYSNGVNMASPNLDTNMVHLTALAPMTRQQVDDLTAFLLTLTDSSFINNMDHMNH